jgi:hypothetical protein
VPAEAQAFTAAFGYVGSAILGTAPANPPPFACSDIRVPLTFCHKLPNHTALQTQRGSDRKRARASREKSFFMCLHRVAIAQGTEVTQGLRGVFGLDFELFGSKLLFIRRSSMGHASLFVPLPVFVDSGKGDLPRVSDANFHQRTTSSRQTSLFPCVPVHRRVLDRTAPAPTVGKISCVQTILRGNKRLRERPAR